MGAIDSRIIVVTGGAIGIGKATALAFGSAGEFVYVLDVDAEAGAEVCEQLDQSAFIACDVTSEHDVSTAMERISDESGRIDVLVNNAGGFPEQRTIEDTDLDEWHRIVDLNLTSVFLTTRAAIPLLRRSGAGRVVNLGSLAGQVANYRTAPPYAAAKAGVHGLTRVLATELAQDGITVNALAPSAVMTERIELLRDEAERRATAATIPLGRYQDPDEVAQWVVFLASSEAAFMTGQTVSVNGGRFMT
ncbi:MAG: SDR family NAD(P)-dependent oxidoreductase [Acidimicrobiia bacterium]